MKKLFFSMLFSVLAINSAMAAAGTPAAPATTGFWSHFEGMNALTVVFASLCIFAIAYRFYGVFIANKVLRLDANRTTPAVKYADGHDYVKTNKNVLFGHHFAAIAAAGPLVGPVLAAPVRFYARSLVDSHRLRFRQAPFTIWDGYFRHSVRHKGRESGNHCRKGN